MQNKRYGAIALSLAVAVATAAAFALNTYTIKRTPKEGETARYEMKGEIDAGVATVTITSKIDEKITKVEPNGNFHVEQKQSETKIMLGTEPLPGGEEGQAHTTVIKPNGEIAEILGKEVDGVAYRMENLNLFTDPGKPVAINDTWSKELKGDAKTGAVAVRADYKIVAEEKVGEYDTLKIRVTVKETEGAMPATSDNTIWLNRADWTLVKGEYKWTNAPVPGAPMPVNGTVTITRIK